MYLHNLYDRFRDHCSKSAKYPWTLLRTPRPHEAHAREAHFEKLQRDEERLFDGDEANLEIWETGRDNRFGGHTLTDLDGMRTHLERVRKDPHIRHAFLESADSRSPLNCSMDMFKYLSTYQQVEDSFLDSVYSFGEQDEPIDLCLMNFRSNDTLQAPEDKIVALPELGRSGRTINVSFLIRSVENDMNKDGVWPWHIRQATVYHSFDMITGRTFWFTVKGNKKLSQRIKSSYDYLDVDSSNKDVGSYFKASLATHLVYLSWCDDNWRSYINDIEDGVRDLLEHARKAPIDDHLEDDAPEPATYPKSLRGGTSRQNTIYSKAPSKTNTGFSMPGIRRKSTWDVIVGTQKSLMSYVNSKPKDKVLDLEKGVQPTRQRYLPSNNSRQALIDPRKILDEFRFKHVQTLHTFNDRIQRASLTLKLNIGVVESMHQYYSRVLTTDTKSPGGLDKSCHDSLAEFLNELQSIAKILDTRREQLECLAAQIREGNTLYDGILQYRSLHIGQLFAEAAQESAGQMEVIANKTAIETASMHVITVVTLIFLPATFVATFFQSGVFLWNDNTPDNMTDTFQYRGDSFSLFVSVSGPLMVLTLGIWLFVFLGMRKKFKQ